MAVTGAVALAILLAVYVAKLRRKETRFGCVGLFVLPVGGREGPGGSGQTINIFRPFQTPLLVTF